MSELAVMSLPRIVRFICTDDCPGGECPHCGASGRWIHVFQVDGGRTLGAMSGCIKLFPIAPIANEDLKLRKKEADCKKRGWNPASWDAEKRKAIDAFYAGEITEDRAMVIIRCAKGRAANYRARRYGA